MKKICTLIMIIFGLIFSSLKSCPHCIDKTDEKSPPFFTDEYYERESAESSTHDPAQTNMLSLLEKHDKGDL